MTIFLTFLILIPLCSVLNRARGYKSWCAHLYGGLVAVLLAAYIQNAWLLAFYPFFIFGECFGWGSLIGGVLDGKDETEEQSQMLLSVRGAWWWGGNLALFSACGCQAAAVLFSVYAISLMFPLSVKLAMKLTKAKQWELSEWIYGAVHGAVIALCVVSMKG